MIERGKGHSTEYQEIMILPFDKRLFRKTDTSIEIEPVPCFHDFEGLTICKNIRGF